MHIWLEDVSYADRRSIVVGETVLADIAHAQDATRVDGSSAVDFCIRSAAPIEPDHDYNVRVWLDRDADGKPGPGDLWSDQGYRVLTRGARHEVAINLVER